MKKDLILELLRLDMPAEVIIETLQLTKPEFFNTFGGLVAERKWTENKIISLYEAKPKMLWIYAHLCFVPEKVHYSGNKETLKNALEKTLEIQQVQLILEYAFQDKQKEQTIWNDFLRRQTFHEEPFLRPEQFQWDSNHFIKKVIAKPKDGLLCAPIVHLGLSSRVKKIFREAEMFYLFEICIIKNNEDLMKYRNIGKKTADEIERHLNELGVPLGSVHEAERERLMKQIKR